MSSLPLVSWCSMLLLLGEKELPVITQSLPGATNERTKNQIMNVMILFQAKKLVACLL
jgi:hypothetical protein